MLSFSLRSLVSSDSLSKEVKSSRSFWNVFSYVSGTCGHNLGSNFLLMLAWFFKVASFLLAYKSQFWSKPPGVVPEPAVPSIMCTSCPKSMFSGRWQPKINYSRNIYTIEIGMHYKNGLFNSRDSIYHSLTLNSNLLLKIKAVNKLNCRRCNYQWNFSPLN